MSSGWVTDTCPLGVLIRIGVPEANAVLLNPEALPAVEVAVLLVLDELALPLEVLLEPQPASTAAAITAALTRLAVDGRARRGDAKRRGFVVGSDLVDMGGGLQTPPRPLVTSS